MKRIKYLGLCLIAASLVACGESKPKDAAQAEEMQTEAVEKEAEEAEEAPLYDSPTELADFAVECFRSGEKAKLLDYATENYAQKLKRDLETEEMMKNDRAMKDMRKQMESTTYTRVEEADLGAKNKQMVYKSKPSGWNLRVLLENKDGKWLIDLLAPAR